MAKNMARIKDGVVINIEWCSDEIMQTDSLIEIVNKSIAIGDNYVDGKFYNNGIEVLSENEKLLKQIIEYEQELAILDTALLDAQYTILIGGL